MQGTKRQGRPFHGAPELSPSSSSSCFAGLQFQWAALLTRGFLRRLFGKTGDGDFIPHRMVPVVPPKPWYVSGGPTFWPR